MSYLFTSTFVEYTRECVSRPPVVNTWVDPAVYIPWPSVKVASPPRKGDFHTDLPYWTEWFEFNRPLPDGASQVIDCKKHRNSLCASAQDSWVLSGTGDYTDVYRWMPNSWRPTVPRPSEELVSFLRDAALTSALANAKKAHVNVGILIAERAETIRLLRDKGRTLTQLATAEGRASLKRWSSTLLKDRRRVYKEIASRHLEFLFGVLPLVGEIEGLMDLLAEEPTLTITGRGRRADVTEVFLQPFAGGGGWNSGYSWSATGKHIIRTSVRASLKYKLTVYNKMSVRTLGLNPLAVTYDIIPLSFLSDFISNLGSFIRSLDPTPGMEFDTGCWTLYNQSTMDGIVRPVNPKGFFDEYHSSGTFEFGCEAGRMDRTALLSEPSPTFQFQNNMSLAKVITISALAVQRYLKPLQRVVRKQRFRYRGPRPKFLPNINYTNR